jgi:hypothetical protein
MDASNPIETTNFSGRGSNESNFSNTPEEKSILLKKLSPRSPMNFNDYLNLRRMKTKTI